VFPSYYILRSAKILSNLVIKIMSIFIPKSKNEIYRDGNTVVIFPTDNYLQCMSKLKNRKVFIVSKYLAKFR